MSQDNMQHFSETEEQVFALLDNSEKTQAQVSALVEKLTSVLERLEQSENERHQQAEILKQQAITAEKQRQSEWETWKKQQVQLWQAEQKSQFENWQQSQVSEWQTWQTVQQQQLTNSLSNFNQSADSIVKKLDEKVRNVNLTQTTVEGLIQNGSSQAIEKLIGEQVKLTVGKKFQGIVDSLNQTDNYIQTSQKSAQQLKNTFIELENSAFDTLSNKVESQVKIGVENGLTAGLAESSQKIGETLENVEKQRLATQNSLVDGLEQAVNKMTKLMTRVEHAIYAEYEQHKIKNDSIANASMQSLSKVKTTADEAVEQVAEYHDKLVNSGQKKWVLGWTAFLTAFVIIAGVITYQVNKPDYQERDRVGTETAMLLQQKSAIEHSYVMQKSKSQDGKFYVWVDKGDCIDGDYCKQREPTSFTTPTPQQLTPPKPTYQPTLQVQQTQTQSSYQPSTSGGFGNGSNPYGKPNGNSNNPFESSGSSGQNPYKTK